MTEVFFESRRTGFRVSSRTTPMSTRRRGDHLVSWSANAEEEQKKRGTTASQGDTRTFMSTNISQERSTARSRALVGVWTPSDAPQIFGVVLANHWDMVNSMLDQEEHRERLGYADSHGYTALHYTSWSSSVPLAVVSKMISHSPENAIRRTTTPQGRTPLHFASWSGRDDVTRLLVSECPSAASILDRCGKSPLCDACTRNRSVPVLKALLDADLAQLSVQNRWGRTPAVAFFRTWHGWICDSFHSKFTRRMQRRDYLAKAMTILEAEYRYKHGSDVEIDDRRILEAAIEATSCPIACIRILLERHANEISVIRDGSTLLHVALNAFKDADPSSSECFYKCDKCHKVPKQNEDDGGIAPRMLFGKDPDRPHWGVICDACKIRRNAANDADATFLNYVRVPVVNKETAVIDAILSHCPTAASVPDSQGQKPLTLALHCNRQWSSGIKSILEADRAVLRQKDSVTKLYPFMLAAVGEEEECDDEPPRKKRKAESESDVHISKESIVSEHDSVKQLTTIYSLLTEDPSVLSSAFTG